MTDRKANTSHGQEQSRKKGFTVHLDADRALLDSLSPNEKHLWQTALGMADKDGALRIGKHWITARQIMRKAKMGETLFYTTAKLLRNRGLFHRAQHEIIRQESSRRRSSFTEVKYFASKIPRQDWIPSAPWFPKKRKNPHKERVPRAPCFCPNCGKTLALGGSCGSAKSTAQRIQESPFLSVALLLFDFASHLSGSALQPLPFPSKPNLEPATPKAGGLGCEGTLPEESSSESKPRPWKAAVDLLPPREVSDEEIEQTKEFFRRLFAQQSRRTHRIRLLE